jgi:DNA-binding NtrC family response regulator
MIEKTRKLLGSSAEFLRAVHTARMVAGTDASVLVLGERGVGKELLAREIHASSRRREKPFQVVNCSGLTEEQLDQKLSECSAAEAAESWGEAGAGEGGTLFLDEVGELSPEAQARLLNFLESQESGHAGCLNVRVIASSSADLQVLADRGRLRSDLFYRLYVVPVDVPPLRERGGDIVLLLKQFSAELAHQHGRKAPRYSVTSRNLLKTYRWPGNVRELSNFCERMVILMAGKIVQPENLPIEIRRGTEQTQEKGRRFVLPAEGLDLIALEEDMIRQALGLTGGNRSKAARLLRITRDTLLYRIQKYAIDA